MPDIPLTDLLGLSLDGALADDAKLPDILPAFTRLTSLQLDHVPIAEASGGLNLSKPIELADGLGIEIGGSGGGGFSLIGHKDRSVDESDPFSMIPVLEDEMYLGIVLRFSLSAGVDASVSSVTLGFSGEKDFEIHCYRRFQRGPAGFPTFGQAFSTALSSFLLPKDALDLDRLQPDTILVLSGSGTLRISAGISVSMPVQSLASVSLPANLKLEAEAGAEVSVSAGVTLSGGYQVRLRRTTAGKTELGFYRSRSREADFRISAEAGVSASAGGFELTERVIGALSRQPVVDKEEFKKVLPGENTDAQARRIESFQKGIEAAISTKLEISVSAAFSKLQSHEAAWLLEIDPLTSLSDVGRAAVAEAFNGRLDVPPPGIRQISNVVTDTDARKVTVKVNLLGLANIISVGKLTQMTTTEHNGNGDITVITDTSTESRLRALLVTFGGDRKRLRKLLSEDFLIAAAYRANDVGVLSPAFKARHRFFEIDDSTNAAEMKNFLDVARALELMTLDQANTILGKNKNFGRVDFYAETGYTNDGVRAAFQAENYEYIGRQALGELLKGDSGQEFRLRVAENDDLWREMKRIQNRAGFPPLFGLSAGALDPRVEAAGADFSAIQTWALAMAAAGQAIQEVDTILGQGPVAADDARLTQARAVLKDRLGSVVKNTKEEFGDPLGMVMFFEASNRNADRRLVIALENQPPIELSAKGTLMAHA